MSLGSNGLRAGLIALAAAMLPAEALSGEFDLTVDPVKIDTGKFTRSGVGFNGASPGPVLRFKEGEDVTIRVTNNLSESTSVHWHGIILPTDQDGVPGISYDGIAPGETFTYRFPIVQSGTYWFHSHSGFQEPDGAYGAIVIEPRDREPFRYDRDYVVQLTDAHPHRGSRIFRNLKMMPDYYNRQQRTLGDLIRDVGKDGLSATMADRAAWGEMRMMPTDVEDVQGFTPLINGKSEAQNWTGLFTPGERVRLRFINSSAMAYFDIRIPGLKMTVVQADGNNVQPVSVDELRIAVAETYDVIVRPTEDQAYTIFAESMGRSAFARGTLAPREGMEGEVPQMRKPSRLTMADMGMAHGGMDHGAMPGMDMTAKPAGTHTMPDGTVMTGAAEPQMPGMDHSKMGQMTSGGTGGATHTMPDGTAMKGMDHGAMPGMDMTAKPAGTHTMPDGTVMTGAAEPQMTGMDHSKMGQMTSGGTGGATHTMPDGTAMKGMDHGAMPGMNHGAMAEPAGPEFYALGSGIAPVAADGGKFLSYADLRAQNPLYPDREPTREIELRLTGNMERYIWSIDGVKFSDAEPIRLQYGERVRFKFVNDTMMSHPMHLHGMWSILENGNGAQNPAKHTISVAPGTTVYMETEVDAPGQWAFHCHLSYHMDAGMMRKVVVEGGPRNASLNAVRGG